MPPMVGPGLGAGEVATAACRTGLPLNLLGSVTTAAGAAATGFSADMLPTFARHSGVFFFVLGESPHHVIECRRPRRPAERDQAERSTGRPRKKLIPHDVFPTFEPDSTSERRERKVYQMPNGRLARLVNEIFVTC